MSLYPSFDEICLDEINNVHISIEPDQKKEPSNKDLSLVSLAESKSLYPILSEYMGLDISNQKDQTNQDAAKKAVSVQSQATITMAAVPGQVTQGLRRLTLCKDKNGRVGLLTSEISQGIFVCFVLNGSPAALGGLRFGDQILQINETLVAGFSAKKVHELIKKCSVNNINFIVRDRPLERCVTMQKNNVGHVGFEYRHGKITALVKDSSAARNGLLTDHQLLEVQGKNVIGYEDNEISKLIQDAGQIVTVTIIPSYLYDRMMKKMRTDYIKAKMDHSSIP